MHDDSGKTSRDVSFTLLGAAGFGSVICTRMCDPMLPTLAREFGATLSEAAATISSYAIAYSVMQLVYGPMGDRCGKLRTIGFASVLLALSAASAAFSTSLDMLVLARLGMGAGGAAIVPLVIAWIGDTVPLEQRQQRLASYASFTVVGMVVGQVISGLFAQFLSWRAAFVVVVPLFATVAVMLLRPGVRDAPAAAPGPSAVPAPPYLQQVRDLLRAPRTRIVLLVTFFETALGIATLAFVPMVLYQRFGLEPLYGGAIAALFGVGGFAFTRGAAGLLERFGRPAMPAIGGVVLALAHALLAVLPHWGWAALACTLAGFGFFAIHNTLQVQATQLSPTATGLAVSLFASCIFLGQSAGVAVGAITFVRFDPAWGFATSALGALALGIAVRGVVLRQPATPVTVHDAGPLAS